MTEVRLKRLLSEVDERLGVAEPDLPLLSVSEYTGVTRRKESVNQAASEDLSKYKIARRGQIVLNRMWAFRGALGVAPEDGIVSPDYAVFQVADGISEPWLEYVMRSMPFVAEMTSRIKGVASAEQSAARSPRVNVADVLDIRWPVPSLDKQKEIVAYFDKETLRIDGFIGGLLKYIELLNNRWKSVVSEAMASCGGARVALRDLSLVPIKNGLGEAGNPDNPKEWPTYIRTTDIVSLTRLDPQRRVTLNPALAAKAQVLPNDILLTCAGATVGKAYFRTSSEQACYAGYLARWRPRSEAILPKFAAYWTQSQQYSDSIATGLVKSTIENFSAAKYSKLRMSVPPLLAQRRIVDSLDLESASLEAMISIARETIALSKERRESLIAETVPGRRNGLGEG